MTNLLENIPIDDWGVLHAPKLVENIDTHLAVLADAYDDEARYAMRRLIMFGVREWAQDKLKEITNDGQEPCQANGEESEGRSTFIPEDD
jgi:hypothetical protein